MLQLLRQATAHPLMELTRQQRQLVGPKQADEMTAVRGVVSQPALDHCGREAEFQALLPLLPAHLPAPLFEAFLQLLPIRWCTQPGLLEAGQGGQQAAQAIRELCQSQQGRGRTERRLAEQQPQLGIRCCQPLQLVEGSG